MTTSELAKLLSIPKLPKYLDQVDQILIDSLNSAAPSIKIPALRLINGGGKRLRPFLVIAAAASQTKNINNDVLKACAAVELVHLGTIVHDDIIDNSEYRWGLPTINHEEGISQAIIIGDYLLGLSTQIALSVGLEVSQTLATSVMAICNGQSQETADEYNSERSVESYNSVISQKTASLTSAACSIGGICAGLTSKQIESLAQYGESFGMSFQLIDDLMDILSSSDAMGKPVGNDLKEGIYTLPILLGLRSTKGKRVRSWLGKQPSTTPSQQEIVDTLIKAGAIEETLVEIRRNNQTAAKKINKVGKNSVLDGLAKLPDAYLIQALDKCKTY